MSKLKSEIKRTIPLNKKNIPNQFCAEKCGIIKGNRLLHRQCQSKIIEMYLHSLLLVFCDDFFKLEYALVLKSHHKIQITMNMISGPRCKKYIGILNSCYQTFAGV